MSIVNPLQAAIASPYVHCYSATVYYGYKTSWEAIKGRRKNDSCPLARLMNSLTNNMTRRKRFRRNHSDTMRSVTELGSRPLLKTLVSWSRTQSGHAREELSLEKKYKIRKQVSLRLRWGKTSPTSNPNTLYYEKLVWTLFWVGLKDMPFLVVLARSRK